MSRGSTLAPGGWLDAVSWAAIIAFVATISLGIIVPIYVDEVATKLVQARFLAEGGQMLSLFPQCSAGFILDTPLTWYPAALVFAGLYGHLQPLGIRIAGLAVFAAWLAVFTGWIFLASTDARQRLRAVAGMAAILGLGVLPLTMVLARPEQWLLLVVTSFLLLAAGAGRVAAYLGRIGGPAALLSAFLLLTSLLNYAHPKALFFLPFVLVAAWYVFGKEQKWLLGAAVAFALFCAYQTFHFAQVATQCEEAPILSGILRAQTTSVTLLLEDPAAFLGEVSTNLLAAPGRIAAHGVFQSAYQSAWLPPVPFAAESSGVHAINLATTGIWYLALLFSVLLPPLVFFLTPGQLENATGRLLAPALWIGLVGHLALYKEWNFYGGTLVLPIAGLLLVHSLGRLRSLASPAWLASGVFASVFLLLLASIAVLTQQLAPRLLQVARTAAELPSNQPYSVNAFAYPEARHRIRSLAEDCGVPGDGATRLVVDDLSYFAFTGLRQPIHLGFLAPGGWGADIAGKTGDLLVGMQSEGIIARCDLMGPEFRYQTMREGNLCCVDLKDRNYY